MVSYDTQTENPAELVLPPISLSEEAQDTLSGTQEIATYSSEEDDIIIERDVRDKAANISTRQGLSARRGTVLPNSSFLANEVSGIYRISSGRRLSSDDAPHRTSMMRKGSFLFPTSPESSVTKELYSDFDGELVPVRHYDM